MRVFNSWADYSGDRFATRFDSHVDWIKLLDLLLPANCSGCGKPPSPCCAQCLPVARPKLAFRTGIQVAVSVDLDETVAKLITDYKDKGQIALARGLSALVSSALDFALQNLAVTTPVEVPALTWVPSSRVARRRRGFEPNRLLLEKTMRFRRLRKLPTLAITPTLSHVSANRDQSGLNRSDRFDNTTGMFAATRESRGVLLFDDILTTGATMGSAVSALSASGTRVLGCFALAETRLRLPMPGESRIAKVD